VSSGNLKRITIWAFIIGVALGGGAFVSALTDQGGRRANDSRTLQEIPQASHAEDNGITLEALGAVFSGTETVLRLRISSADPAQADIFPAANGFLSNDFAGTNASFQRDGDHEILVRLPRFSPPEEYDGSTTIEFNALHVTGDPVVRIDGSWPLLIGGPTPGDLASAMRVELVESEPFEVMEAEGVTVRGLRSRTETILTITHSSALRFLVSPELVLPTGRLAALGWDRTATGSVARFAATEFGSAMDIDLGTVGIEQDSSFVFTVNVEGAADRVDGEFGAFPISPGDVLVGSAEMVTEGQIGFQGEQRWIGLQIRGNFHPQYGADGDIVSPEVLDQDGNRLPIASIGVGYTKDEQGNVGPGATDIRAFISDYSDVELLILRIDQPTLTDSRPLVRLEVAD